MSQQDQNIREDSLAYHRRSPPGKISLAPTKQLTNQRDLALAYSPGVAAACDEIVRDPREAATLTARGNLVGVVTNGTAVLGLGNIGALAGKPVMEGKAVLFKKFAGLDCFDIEIDERDPDKLIDMICALEPTFGGINLEDIKSPECFYIERKCRERMKIPVFHDDQHGTAIIVGAAVVNGLRIVGKKFEDVKLVCSGAGAARSPASICWSGWVCGARTSSSPTSRGSSTKAAPRKWTTTRRATRSRRRRARWPRSCRVPTSSSDFPRRAC
jgi:malate dehydrogenase (oxaloacetate-decarboxylating)(NADP+)